MVFPCFSVMVVWLVTGCDSRWARGDAYSRCWSLKLVCGHPSMQNKMHINDWAAIQTLFDKLNKQLERTQKVR